jgi:hypothetical protein
VLAVWVALEGRASARKPTGTSGRSQEAEAGASDRFRPSVWPSRVRKAVQSAADLIARRNWPTANRYSWFKNATYHCPAIADKYLPSSPQVARGLVTRLDRICKRRRSSEGSTEALIDWLSRSGNRWR